MELWSCQRKLKNKAIYAAAIKFARTFGITIEDATSLIEQLVYPNIVAQDMEAIGLCLSKRILELNRVNHQLTEEKTMLTDYMEMSLEVIRAINDELHYQSTLTNQDRADNIDHGVEGRLVTLAVYTRKAEEAWVNNPGEEKALHELRKVAAIAIRALEQYGCPKREEPQFKSTNSNNQNDSKKIE